MKQRRRRLLSGGKNDDTSWSAILVDSLKDLRVLTRETFRREHRVGLYGGDVTDFCQHVSDGGAACVARRATEQMLLCDPFWYAEARVDQLVV
jgi:hypothetical protein